MPFEIKNSYTRAFHALIPGRRMIDHKPSLINHLAPQHRSQTNWFASNLRYFLCYISFLLPPPRRALKCHRFYSRIPGGDRCWCQQKHRQEVAIIIRAKYLHQTCMLLLMSFLQFKTASLTTWPFDCANNQQQQQKSKSKKTTAARIIIVEDRRVNNL